MMNNPGKYDDLCTLVREQGNAQGAIVIIVDGNKGSGFSVQASMYVIAKLPDMLEYMAAEIRKGNPG